MCRRRCEDGPYFSVETNSEGSNAMQTILIVDDDDEVPACVVTDIRLSGPFRYEGLDFITDVRRHSEDARIIVMTGAWSEELQREALARGATAVLHKPFDTADLEAYLPEPAGTGEPS